MTKFMLLDWCLAPILASNLKNGNKLKQNKSMPLKKQGMTKFKQMQNQDVLTQICINN